MLPISRKALIQQLLGCLVDARPGLSLHYQPIFGLGAHRVLQWEGLIRWHHATLGTIAPSVILTLVHESKAELELLAWVMDTACAAMAGDPELQLSLNMHASLLGRQTRLLDAIDRPLSRHAVDPRRIELEVTETEAYPTGTVARASFRALQQRGIGLALDDFGSGFAGLSVLREYRFDRIKLDNVFVRSTPGDARTAAILRNAVELCHALDTPLTAEGIETAAQLAHVRTMPIDRGQGFLLGPPMPAEQIRGFLATTLSPPIASHAFAARTIL